MSSADCAPLRWGVIGTGMMGIEHILNVRLVDGAEVVAFADPHPTSRKWGRDTAGPAAREYGDHRELLADPDVDAVIVASPNFTHAAVLRDAFAGDKHLLIEKPLCTTLEDCRWVVEAAEKHPGLVWVAMEYRYMPPAARLIEEVHSGRLGRLRMLAIREHRLPFLKKVGDWNRFNRNTGGTLVEKCCHFFDLMRLITRSEPMRVFASGAQDVNHLDERYDGEVPDILDNAFVIVDYESGCRASLDLCMFAESSRNEQELVATGSGGKVECLVSEGRLTIGAREYRKYETIDVREDERVRYRGFHHGASYLEHLDFLDAVRNGKPPRVTAADGLLSVAMGIAAHRSIDEGRPVTLAELGV